MCNGHNSYSEPLENESVVISASGKVLSIQRVCPAGHTGHADLPSNVFNAEQGDEEDYMGRFAGYWETFERKCVRGLQLKISKSNAV